MLKLRSFVKRLFGFVAADDYTAKGKQLSHICFRENELIASDGHVLAIMDLSKNNEYHNTNVKHNDVLMSKNTLKKIFMVAKKGGKHKPQEIDVIELGEKVQYADLNSGSEQIEFSHPREDVYPTGINNLFPKKDKLKAEIDIDARFLSLVKELCECSLVKHVHLKIYGDTDPVVFEIKNDTIPNVRGLIMPIRSDAWDH